MGRLTVAERLARRTRVDLATGCIEWTGPLVGGGYAQMSVGGRRYYVHRLAWEIENGQIPEGRFLDHLCRNRRCCNPDHLEPVTFRENVLRGISSAAVNAVKTECPEGHPYSPGNTYTNPAGSRVCRTCKNRRERERRARFRAA